MVVVIERVDARLKRRHGPDYAGGVVVGVVRVERVEEVEGVLMVVGV